MVHGRSLRNPPAQHYQLTHTRALRAGLFALLCGHHDLRFAVHRAAHAVHSQLSAPSPIPVFVAPASRRMHDRVPADLTCSV
jgi:hypothetical protein